ncbi:hypothetical protein WN943_029044 [Citrus x changshan-huyou]
MKPSSLHNVYLRFKPLLLMVLAQLSYTFLYFITEASFNHGMNPHVYVTYRHIVAGIAMFPFAYFLERKIRPKLTLALFLEIFVLSLVGVTLTLNMYFASLRYTSPTFVASVVNTVAAVTFVIAVVLSITWSAMYIMQAITLKRYPAQLSLTTWMCFLGAAQSAVFTVIVARKPADWRIGLNIDLWSTIYGGVVVSGLIVFIQLWCTDKRGPVFATMFNPVSTILVAILAYFVFGEKLFLGSIVGAVVVIGGLYLLLWGKEGDHQEAQIKTKEQSDPKILQGEP